MNTQVLAPHRPWIHDIILMGSMVILAACGLIYQYLLSHYAGRVLGMMEHAIFTMIGIMIVSMGIGAFAAKWVRCPFTGFAWLEVAIGILGATAILIVGGAFALTHILPHVVSDHFGIPQGTLPAGILFSSAVILAETSPYVIGFIIGVFIGMEIPFIARVREIVHGRHLEHNVGSIYGADYVGAGIGAAIFIIYMLSIPPEKAALWTALCNVLVGMIFLTAYRTSIRHLHALWALHILTLLSILLLFPRAENWHTAMEDMLYADTVTYSASTQHQHITLTKRLRGNGLPPIHALYLNGRLQLSSHDEHRYHAMLVHPVLMASARQENILIIGGGDGMAIREALSWNPKSITLVDLDKEMVQLFSKPLKVEDVIVNQPFLELNEHAFSDERVNVVFGDAFTIVDDFMAEGKIFDSIIVDLPDPSHPDLNKVYSVNFYRKLLHILGGDGAIGIQSTSPYHAKAAFLTVKASVKTAGFQHVEQYQQNIPSFGQWGWTIASKHGASPKKRIMASPQTVPDNWLNKEMILASFLFGKDFYDHNLTIKPNRIGTNQMYFLHQKAWMATE